VFTYQALHGAACFQQGRLDAALALSHSLVRTREQPEGAPLYEQRGLVGWPVAIRKDSARAWHYLVKLSDALPWILEAFDSLVEYRASLLAYFFALDIQELARRVAHKEDTNRAWYNWYRYGSSEADQLMPGMSFRAELTPEEQARAYGLLENRPEDVKSIWRRMGFEDWQIGEKWNGWIGSGRSFRPSGLGTGRIGDGGIPTCTLGCAWTLRYRM